MLRGPLAAVAVAVVPALRGAAAVGGREVDGDGGVAVHESAGWGVGARRPGLRGSGVLGARSVADVAESGAPERALGILQRLIRHIRDGDRLAVARVDG